MSGVAPDTAAQLIASGHVPELIDRIYNRFAAQRVRGGPLFWGWCMHGRWEQGFKVHAVCMPCAHARMRAAACNTLLAACAVLNNNNTRPLLPHKNN
jgi:hypothetical protein